MSAPLLNVSHLSVDYEVRGGYWRKDEPKAFRAVNDVSLQIAEGEVLGLVGESGCGKSTLARAIVRLVEARSGKIELDGEDLLQLPPEELRETRRLVQMVFQDPYASLNPRRTVFSTLAEPLKLHHRVSEGTMADAVGSLMQTVGLEPRFMRKYPHEFSGGQRQRIAIARALAPGPRLMIADEPVSALDVSVQAQVLNLLSDLRRKNGLAMLFISHDLSVVQYIADRILVMYHGRIVESGPSEAVFTSPQHPYTKELLNAIPGLVTRRQPGARVKPVVEAKPSDAAGCPYYPRCAMRQAFCERNAPALHTTGSGRKVACICANPVFSIAGRRFGKSSGQHRGDTPRS